MIRPYRDTEHDALLSMVGKFRFYLRRAKRLNSSQEWAYVFGYASRVMAETRVGSRVWLLAHAVTRHAYLRSEACWEREQAKQLRIVIAE